MMTYDHEVRDDAFAATWLRLAERLSSIREPEKLPGWLATTACNEVRQILRQRGRQHTSLNDAWGGASGSGLGDLLDTLAGDDGEHADQMMADESRRQVRAAFGRLDEPCREIITVLVLADPPVPYDEASERLGRPIGSLGPSRRRCLEKMKGLLARASLPAISREVRRERRVRKRLEFRRRDAGPHRRCLRAFARSDPRSI